jgi:hypothetical protein
MKKKSTSKGKSYWDKSGVYQKEYDQLYKELVPDFGETSTSDGRLLRSITRLYYDYCNNGNGNVFTESWGEVEMNSMYEEFIENLVFGLMDSKAAKDLEDFLQTPGARNPSFSKNEMNIYDKVMDSVVHQILEERELAS